MKRLLIIIVVMFSMLPLSVQKTQAYWAEDVLSSQSINVASISIGTWNFTATWSSTGIYNTGDKVNYNGVEYIALRNVPAGKIPGANGSKNFWRVN